MTQNEWDIYIEKSTYTETGCSSPPSLIANYKLTAMNIHARMEPGIEHTLEAYTLSLCHKGDLS